MLIAISHAHAHMLSPQPYARNRSRCRMRGRATMSIDCLECAVCCKSSLRRASLLSSDTFNFSIQSMHPKCWDNKQPASRIAPVSRRFIQIGIINYSHRAPFFPHTPRCEGRDVAAFIMYSHWLCSVLVWRPPRRNGALIHRSLHDQCCNDCFRTLAGYCAL